MNCGVFAEFTTVELTTAMNITTEPNISNNVTGYHTGNMTEVNDRNTASDEWFMTTETTQAPDPAAASTHVSPTPMVNLTENIICNENITENVTCVELIAENITMTTVAMTTEEYVYTPQCLVDDETCGGCLKPFVPIVTPQNDTTTGRKGEHLNFES